MLDVIGRPVRAWRAAGSALLLAAALAACGGNAPESSDVVDTDGAVGTESAPTVVAVATEMAEDEATPDTAPQAAQIPQTVRVAIANGKLDPDRLSAVIGSAVVLEVEGDGTPHTLAIDGLVDSQDVAPSGPTSITFTVEGEPGDRTITLDGNEAGVFAVQDAAGSTDDPDQEDAVE